MIYMPGIKHLGVPLFTPRVGHRNHCSCLTNYFISLSIWSPGSLFFELFPNRSDSEFVYVENKNCCFFPKVYRSQFLFKSPFGQVRHNFGYHYILKITFLNISWCLSCDRLLTFGTMVTQVGECYLLVSFWIWARVVFVLDLEEE